MQSYYPPSPGEQQLAGGESMKIASPARGILHPMEKTHGYGRLRHISRMKREKFLYDAHPPLSVRWDEYDLSTFIEMLESCGRNDQKHESVVCTSAVGRFDPRAPHFDVIVIDMTNALSNEELRTALYGSDASETESIPEVEGTDTGTDTDSDCDKKSPALSPSPSLSPPPPSTTRKDMGMLPMESLAGRPGWLFLWVGEASGLIEAKRTMASWGFRKIECIGWMRTDGVWEILSDMDTRSECDDIFRSAVEWCLVGLKGSAKRFVFSTVFCRMRTMLLIGSV